MTAPELTTELPENHDLRLDGELPGRVLVVVAHPDDVDFGVGGTVARFTDAGVPVSYCMVTDGDAGEVDGYERSEIGPLRRREQTAAAKILGVEADDIFWLGFPDGALVADLELRKAISRVIRQVKPDLVIAQSATRAYDRIYASHPDHLAAGEAAICAVYPDSRNTASFPELLDEGFKPHAVNRVWVMGLAEPNHGVDISTTIERKIEALRAHESQTSTYPLETMIPEWAERGARAMEMAAGGLVEAFYDVRA